MIGKTILHYKIIEKLGEGMGVVYLCPSHKLYPPRKNHELNARVRNRITLHAFQIRSFSISLLRCELPTKGQIFKDKIITPLKH